MNKLVILGGNSPKNKLWGEGIAAAFGGLFDDIYQQSYTHWETGEETINFDLEAEKLRDVVARDDGGTRYFIFAKSFGSILSLVSTYKGYIKPDQCVFFGMPFNLVRDHDIFKGDWSPLSDFRVPALVFHNEHDPVADLVYTSEKLTDVPSVALVTTEGDNHGYFEFGSYEEKIKAFLNL